MVEYVDKDKAAFLVERASSKADAITALKMMSAADVVPVRHGYWKEDMGGYGFWICSCCGFLLPASGANILYKYCPNCGAEMRKGCGDE